MDAGVLFGRGIAFPPHLGADGRWAWSEGPDNIRESIQVVLMTEPGERLRLPGFGSGLRRLLFEPNSVATRRLVQEAIETALREWEPRIELESVVVEPAEAADAALATLTYRLVASGAAEQTIIRIPLAG